MFSLDRESRDQVPSALHQELSLSADPSNRILDDIYTVCKMIQSSNKAMHTPIYPSLNL